MKKLHYKYIFKTIFLSIPILTFTSCIGNQENTNKNKTTNLTKEINTSISTDSQKKANLLSHSSSNETYFDFSQTFIKEDFRDSISVKFSDSKTYDLFTFYVPKGTINETTSVLKIYDTHRTLLYELAFQTGQLINGHDLIGIKDDIQMHSYIKGKAKEVLNLSSFLDFNNLNKESYLNEVAKEDFLNYKVLEKIKSEKRFIFNLAREEENIIYFGFDTTTKQIVKIYTCC